MLDIPQHDGRLQRQGEQCRKVELWIAQQWPFPSIGENVGNQPKAQQRGIELGKAGKSEKKCAEKQQAIGVGGAGLPPLEKPGEAVKRPQTYDHPPLSAWLEGLAGLAFGWNVFALRLMVALALAGESTGSACDRAARRQSWRKRLAWPETAPALTRNSRNCCAFGRRRANSARMKIK
jgi:hypothetical protein